MEQDKLFEYISRKDKLSYRRFNRLNPKQKDNYLKSKLEPEVKGNALIIMKYYNISLRKSLRLANSTWDAYLEWAIKRDHPKFHTFSDDKVIKELTFRGFVPASEYKMRKGYSYIVCNKLLENKNWIYPERLANNYANLQKGKRYIIPLFAKLGLEGYTKIIF